MTSLHIKIISFFYSYATNVIGTLMILVVTITEMFSPQSSDKMILIDINNLFPYNFHSIGNAVNEAMSRRAVYKAFWESTALVGASVLQVYLLRRLFERKLGMSRV